MFSNKLFCIIWLVTFLLQILIVTKGGFCFSTKPLNLDHWAWCIGLGVFELILGQVNIKNLFNLFLNFKIIITIPSNILPKFFAFGRGEVQPTPILVTGEYDIPEVRQISGKEVGGVHPPHSKARSGQILWLLGLTRLQTQVHYYFLFFLALKKNFIILLYLLFVCLYLFVLF